MGIEVALLGLAAAGTVASYEQSRKAASAQRDAMREEKKRADIQNVRSIRQNIRQARMAQATMTNQAALGGGMGGSALAGGVSSVGSQLAGNLGYMSDIADANTGIFNAQMSTINAQQNAA